MGRGERIGVRARLRRASSCASEVFPQPLCELVPECACVPAGTARPRAAFRRASLAFLGGDGQRAEHHASIGSLCAADPPFPVAFLFLLWLFSFRALITQRALVLVLPACSLVLFSFLFLFLQPFSASTRGAPAFQAEQQGIVTCFSRMLWRLVRHHGKELLLRDFSRSNRRISS